jgi:hypothetical protein
MVGWLRKNVKVVVTIWMHYRGIFLERLRNIMQYLSQFSRCTDRNSIFVFLLAAWLHSQYRDHTASGDRKIVECRTVGGMRTGRGNRSTHRKPVPLPLHPPKISHDLTWDKNQAAMLGTRETNRLIYGQGRDTKGDPSEYEPPRFATLAEEQAYQPQSSGRSSSLLGYRAV